MDKKYQPLFESFTYRSGIEVKNRIALAPMTNFSSNPDGTVTDAEVDYYIRRSKGVGMVITACTYVTPNGKGFPGEFGADTDEMIPSLRRLARRSKTRVPRRSCRFSTADANVRQNWCQMVRRSVLVRSIGKRRSADTTRVDGIGNSGDHPCFW